jgi:biotin carboxyl carrier protein
VTFHIQLAGKSFRVDIVPATTPQGPPAISVAQGDANATPVPINVLEIQPGLLSLLFTPPAAATSGQAEGRQSSPAPTSGPAESRQSSPATRHESLEARLDLSPTSSAVVIRGHRYEFSLEDPRSLRSRRAGAGAADGPRTLHSPMPGRVIRILLPQGSEVAAQQGVLVVEAMKMQNELKSPKAGVVTKMLVSEGDTVAAGQPLATIT